MAQSLPMTQQRARISDLLRLKEHIKDSWSLANYLGKCEAEVMVAQTIHAACTNYDEHGLPFSFRDNNVFARGGNVKRRRHV